MRINDGVTRGNSSSKASARCLGSRGEVISGSSKLDVTRMPKVKDTLP